MQSPRCPDNCLKIIWTFWGFVVVQWFMVCSSLLLPSMSMCFLLFRFICGSLESEIKIEKELRETTIALNYIMTNCLHWMLFHKLAGVILSRCHIDMGTLADWHGFGIWPFQLWPIQPQCVSLRKLTVGISWLLSQSFQHVIFQLCSIFYTGHSSST